MKNRRVSTLKILTCVLLVGFVSAPAATAAEKKIAVRFLLQPWFQMEKGGAPDGESWSKEAFLRRSRIILSGQVSERIRFFVETDIPNWGKNGTWSSEMYIQDAYVDFTLLQNRGILNSLNVAAGMILLPFSRHNRQSAASLNTLDYHGDLIRFLPESHKVWRDTGVEIRGLLFDNHLDVRLGIFNGLHGGGLLNSSVNPKDFPRFTGRIQYNVFETEDTFFYGGNYLGSKRILAVGVGLDHQRDAVFVPLLGGGRLDDATAFSADLFYDWPLSADVGLLGLFQYFDYGYGTPSPISYSSDRSGKGFGWELGLRYQKWGPVFSYERFVPVRVEAESAFDIKNWRFGINYWLLGHNANIKLEYARLRRKAGDLSFLYRNILTLQTQILF